MFVGATASVTVSESLSESEATEGEPEKPGKRKRPTFKAVKRIWKGWKSKKRKGGEGGAQKEEEGEEREERGGGGGSRGSKATGDLEMKLIKGGDTPKPSQATEVRVESGSGDKGIIGGRDSSKLAQPAEGGAESGAGEGAKPKEATGESNHQSKAADTLDAKESMSVNEGGGEKATETVKSKGGGENEGSTKSLGTSVAEKGVSGGACKTPTSTEARVAGEAVKQGGEAPEVPPLIIGGRPHLPFQLQIEYTSLDGDRCLRVITQAKPVTRDRSLAERGRWR